MLIHSLSSIRSILSTLKVMENGKRSKQSLEKIAQIVEVIDKRTNIVQDIDVRSQHASSDQLHGGTSNEGEMVGQRSPVIKSTKRTYENEMRDMNRSKKTRTRSVTKSNFVECI